MDRYYKDYPEQVCKKLTKEDRKFIKNLMDEFWDGQVWYDNKESYLRRKNDKTNDNKLSATDKLHD